jgi:hypothetical protein
MAESNSYKSMAYEGFICLQLSRISVAYLQRLLDKLLEANEVTKTQWNAYWEDQAALRRKEPFFEGLNNYLIEKFGVGGTIRANKLNEWKRIKYELNLALELNNSIRIGRICFTNKRNGHPQTLTVVFHSDLGILAAGRSSTSLRKKGLLIDYGSFFLSVN